MVELLLNTVTALCLLIGLGFIAGRWLGVDLRSLAMVAIYIISPIVTFGAVSRLNFTPAQLILPMSLFAMATGISVLAHAVARRFFADETANLVAMAAGTGNTGYFGAPLAMAVLGPEVLGIYLLMNVGMSVAETTVGFYFGARGRHTVADSLKKVVYLPNLYAIALGLIVNIAGIPLPAALNIWWDRFTGAWIVIGMMIIGAALGQVSSYRLNLRLTGLLFAFKFGVWPLATIGLALVDRFVLHLFDPVVHTLLVVIGIVPLAGNTVAFAARLDLRPGEVAVAVLLSTLFSALYIPAVLWLCGIAPG